MRERGGSGSQLQQRALRERSSLSLSLEERVSRYDLGSIPSLPWDDVLSTGDQAAATWVYLTTPVLRAQ